VQEVSADDTIINYIAEIVTSTRHVDASLAYGASPRGSLAMLSLAKALAFLE